MKKLLTDEEKILYHFQKMVELLQEKGVDTTPISEGTMDNYFSVFNYPQHLTISGHHNEIIIERTNK